MSGRKVFPLRLVVWVVVLLLMSVVSVIAAQGIGKLLRGDVIAYGGYNGNFASDLYLLDVTHRVVSPLFSLASSRQTPSWSPDGRYLAYRSEDGVSYLFDFNTEQIELFVDRSEAGLIHAVDWSPDGLSIIMSVGTNFLDNHLYITTVADRELTLLSDRYIYFAYPEWSPDGTKILFSAGTSERTYDLFLMNLADGSMQQMTTLEATTGAASWSHDGQWITFVSGIDQLSEVYIIDAQGENMRQMTSTNSREYAPVWSSDDQHIYFVSENNGSIDVFMVDVVSGEIQQITHDTISEAALDLMP